MKKSAIAVSTAVAALVLSACSLTPAPSGERAILVSIDAFNEGLMREHLDVAQAPALHQIFQGGACTEYAQPMFPSVTAAGHASIWTGAYGNVHNITANRVHLLPRDQHTATATVSGFSADNLGAEPIWISAGLQGLSVGGHHATQGPGEAGFPPVQGERSAAQQAAFERVQAGYALDNVQVMNGYNEQVEGHGIVRGDDVEWTSVSEWRNLGQLGVTIEPKAFTFENRAGRFYGLLFGDERYDRMAIAQAPDLAQAVLAHAQDAETESIEGRALARYFADPLAVETDKGTTFLHARLFEVSRDGNDFMLYHPSMHIMDANHEAVSEGYNDAVQGWFGNSASRMYTDGAFGPTRFQGGDGTAEQRYLETAELLTRQFNRGSSWYWQQQHVDLLVDYFPLGDAIDHSVYTYLDPNWPGYDAQVAEYMAELRRKTWQLVDYRMAHLQTLAGDAGAALFVVGDHGMRSSWLEFRPNVLLQEAGLQVLDDNGMVDLARSKAVAPSGHWITINTTDWRLGSVAPEDKDAVMADVIAALEGATDGNGNAVIERVYRADEHPELGLGGPAGGDIYWAEAPNYRSSRSNRGEGYVSETSPLGWHSYASTDPYMQTVTCAYGGGFAPKRAPASKLIDVAPTVSGYLGIEAPRHSQGRSLLPDLR